MIPNTLNFDINNLLFFIFVGIIIKLFIGTNTTTDGSSGPATAAIWGYGIIAASVLGIMFVTFAMTMRMNKLSNNSYDFLKSLFMHSMVPLLMLIILIWLIVINSKFYTKINQGDVASEFYTYSGVSTFLVIIQIVMLYRYIMDELRISKGGPSMTTNIKEVVSSKLASIAYLLTLGNAILLGIMTIILSYFSTDG